MQKGGGSGEDIGRRGGGTVPWLLVCSWMCGASHVIFFLHGQVVDEDKALDHAICGHF